jgi:hypothetical protein
MSEFQNVEALLAALAIKAFTIKEFCRTHRLSVSTYYKLKKLGLGPREKHIDSRVIITQEAAAEWRAGNDELITNNT